MVEDESGIKRVVLVVEHYWRGGKVGRVSWQSDRVTCRATQNQESGSLRRARYTFPPYGSESSQSVGS
ncbi:hypothetical protein E2C01_014421 [Portunus trituberculatus]|uniref:Uncharacterized protein n=1 Tax=Portunus trituberculatus TaxID=210409 RepID=A0A5B7DJU9_PORTR|nr:hypothetical protein [Portunus trituberculatus]